MKKSIFQFVIIGLILIMLWSCDQNLVFEAYQQIPEREWHKDSLVNFNIPIEDTVQNHNLYINVRNSIDYSYSNLWLFVEIVQPGNISVKDTFELSLADPTGKWLGEGFGGLKTRQVIYKRNVFFPVSGEYEINIQHGMRESILKEISDIGFRVENLNKGGKE